MARPFSTDLARTWNRHCPKCVRNTAYMIGNHAFRNDTQKVCVKCRGSQHTMEIRFHALMTSLYMTKEPLILSNGNAVRVDDYTADMGDVFLTSPLTGRIVNVKQCESDRIDAGGFYIPGNIAMIPHDENEIRHTAKYDENAHAESALRANALIIARRGIRRGPNAFDENVKAMVKGSSQRPDSDYGIAEAIESGPFGL